MFGSVARVRVKVEQEAALHDLMDEGEQRDRSARGMVANFVLRSTDDPQELWAVAVFEDRESYFASANDPEQDKFFRRMREMMESDPEWHDGDVVFAWNNGARHV